jgi:hypothetical protein
MTTGGSQQQRIFRRAIRDGRGIMDAAIEAGIGIGEARLIANEDAANPPPPEAYELLVLPPAVALETQVEIPLGTPAPPSASPENVTMGRAKKSEPAVEQVFTPDYDLAVRLYRQDIRPAIGKVGEHSQEMSTAYKAIKKQAHIQPQAARAAFRLIDMEEAKRDDYLRSFNGLLKALGIFMPVDLVDAAQGKGTVGDSVVPMGQRPRPQLATVPTGPEGDNDLIDAAGGDDQQQAAE